MPRRTLRIPLPALDGGLVSNVVMVASLVAVCVMVAFLTDWRWGGLLAGVLGFAGSAYYQWSAEPTTAKPATEPAAGRGSS